MDPDKIPVPFAPDIAVEVLSASEGAIETNRKVRDYLGVGCHEVWVIDHVDCEFFVHSKSGIRLLLATDVLDSPLLPGFNVPVADVFAS